jgi:hypothetical protein
MKITPENWRPGPAVPRMTGMRMWVVSCRTEPGAGEQRCRGFEAERLRSLEVDDQFELVLRLDGKVAHPSRP